MPSLSILDTVAHTDPGLSDALAGAESASVFVKGGRTFVLTTRSAGTGGAFEVAADGALTLLDTFASGSARTSEGITIGGRDFLVAFGNDGLRTFEIGANGLPTPVDALSEIDGLTAFSIEGMEIVAAHGTHFVVASDVFRDHVLAVPLAADGTLGTAKARIADDAGRALEFPLKLASVEVGGRAFVYVHSSADDNIQILELAADGSLSDAGLAFPAGTAGDNPLDSSGIPRGIAVADAGGGPILIASSGDDLSTWRVEDDGSLSLIQHLIGAARGMTGGGSDLIAAEIAGDVVVLATFEDAGAILYQLAADGSLTERARLEGADGLLLDAMRNGAAFDAGGRLRFAAPEEFLSNPDTLSIIELERGPDLTINAGEFALAGKRATPDFGVPIGFTLNAHGLENAGDVDFAGFARADVFLSADRTLDDGPGGDDYLFTIGANGLDAGEISNGTPGSGDIPAGFGIGDAFLLVSVDPEDGVAEWDEDNNLHVERIQISPFTDFNDSATLPGRSFLPWKALGGDDDIDGSAAGDRVVGGTGDDSVRGRQGDDLLKGNAGADDLRGMDGMDTLLGGAGRDITNGGGGADRALGGAGADQVGGGNGADTLLGGAGNDTVNGGAGNDRMSGGAGRDVFEIAAGDRSDAIADFSAGDLIRYLSGPSSFDDLRIRDRGDDALVIGVRSRTLLEDVDAKALDADDFLFG